MNHTFGTEAFASTAIPQANCQWDVHSSMHYVFVHPRELRPGPRKKFKMVHNLLQTITALRPPNITGWETGLPALFNTECTSVIAGQRSACSYNWLDIHTEVTGEKASVILCLKYKTGGRRGRVFEVDGEERAWEKDTNNHSNTRAFRGPVFFCASQSVKRFNKQRENAVHSPFNWRKLYADVLQKRLQWRLGEDAEVCVLKIWPQTTAHFIALEFHLVCVYSRNVHEQNINTNLYNSPEW